MLEIIELWLWFQVCKGGGSGTGKLFKEIKLVDSLVFGGRNAIMLNHAQKVDCSGDKLKMDAAEDP